MTTTNLFYQAKYPLRAALLGQSDCIQQGQRKRTITLSRSEDPRTTRAKPTPGVLATQGYIGGKEHCQLGFKELGFLRYKGSQTEAKSGWDSSASYGNPWKSCWAWVGRSRDTVFQAAMHWYVVNLHVLDSRL